MQISCTYQVCAPLAQEGKCDRCSPNMQTYHTTPPPLWAVHAPPPASRTYQVCTAGMASISGKPAARLLTLGGCTYLVCTAGMASSGVFMYISLLEEA